MVGVAQARHMRTSRQLGVELVLLLVLCRQENGGNGIAAIETLVGRRVVQGVGDGWEEPHARPLGLRLV